LLAGHWAKTLLSAQPNTAKTPRFTENFKQGHFR